MLSYAPAPEIRRGEPLTVRTLNGFGDLCWTVALLNRVKRTHDVPRIDFEIQQAGDGRDGRSVGWLQRIASIDAVRESPFPTTAHPYGRSRRINYLPTGYQPDGAYFIAPNAWIEWEGRLEAFAPWAAIDWDFLQPGNYLADPLDQLSAGRLKQAGQIDGRPAEGFVTVYFCTQGDNTHHGQNIGGAWRPSDWVQLLARIRRLVTDLPILILGCSYDAPYADEVLSAGASQIEGVENLCGQTTGTEAIELLRLTRLMVSFPSGLAMCSTYLRRPTVCFWNPEGRSVTPGQLVWYSDSFATNWVPPDVLAAGLYHAPVYTRCDVDSVFAQCRAAIGSL